MAKNYIELTIIAVITSLFYQINFVHGKLGSLLTKIKFLGFFEI